ncbi:MAG: sugar ABC transporter substrate-binding protein [Actinomycetota bacterium]
MQTLPMKHWRRWLALLLALSLVAAACGGDDEDEAGDDASASASASATEAEADTGEEASEPAEEPDEAPADDEPAEAVQIAYLSASSANTWLTASRQSMEKVAADNGIEIVEFDAQFDPALQQQQFQDAIASGQYGGIVLVSLTGSGSIPDVEAALDAGIEVVVLNQVVGDDLTTVEPQVDGIAAAVFEPPQIRGERIGDLTLQACADLDPCNVVYFYGIRGVPLDEAVRAGWDSVVDGSAVTVVAEAEGQYLGPDVGLAAMQDILVSNSEIDVVIGADQSMQGVELALDETDGFDDVLIIGFGGSSYAVDAVTDGRWWGGLYGAPATEGELAMEAMVDALAGTDTGGVDPAQSVPNGGLMTPDNIADFTPQWDG